MYTWNNSQGCQCKLSGKVRDKKGERLLLVPRQSPTGFLPLFYWQKKSGTLPRPPWKIFQDLFGAQRTLKVAKFINIPHCIEVSNSQHKLAARLLLSVYRSNHWKNARLSRIFFQDQGDFPGLSRSRSFREKKSRTFREAWEPCTHPSGSQAGATLKSEQFDPNKGSPPKQSSTPLRHPREAYIRSEQTSADLLRNYHHRQHTKTQLNSAIYSTFWR